MIGQPKYGNCFEFNSMGNPHDALGGLRTTAMTGSSFGLFLTLNLQQINYMADGITKQVRFFLH